MWAISVAGDEGNSRKTEISFPQESHILFFYQVSAFIDYGKSNEGFMWKSHCSTKTILRRKILSCLLIRVGFNINIRCKKSFMFFKNRTVLYGIHFSVWLCREYFLDSWWSGLNRHRLKRGIDECGDYRFKQNYIYM